MEFRRVIRSMAGAASYLAVYFVCQMAVSFVVTYSVTIGYVFDYLSADTAGGTDALSNLNLNELMRAAQTAVVEFVTDNLFLISIISVLLTLVTYFIIFKVRKKKFAAEIGIRKMSGFNYPIMIALGVSMNFLTAFLIGILPIPAQLMEDYANASSPITENAITPLAIIFTVIITPIFEETLFRGLVYTRIKRCMPMLGAMILSSFLFGVMHGTSIVWVAYASVFGFFLAWAFEKCGSLLASIIVHAGFNLVGILSTGLPKNISPGVVWSIMAASVIVSVAVIVVVNKKSKVKIEIGMPEWETEND